MPSITFGLNTCYGVKRWPEADAWARIAADLGVRHVQYSFDLLDPLLSGDRAAYRESREVCDALGVTITSAFTGLIGYSQNALAHPSDAVRARAEAWFEAAIEAAAALGARGLGGHIGALSVRQHADPSTRALAVDRTVDAVRRLAEAAARAGLEFLLWEIMPVAREYPSTMAEADKLLGHLARRRRARRALSRASGTCARTAPPARIATRSRGSRASAPRRAACTCSRPTA